MQGATKNVIVDTDVGSDDLLAIAFLLARSDVNIEAITVVNGLAHVQAGGTNILKLLELAGKPRIPVYVGRATPSSGTNEFPETWRVTADALPSITLPETSRKVEEEDAETFLARRLSMTGKPVTVLAIGPLTNLAGAFQKAPRAMYGIEDLVIMGGAVKVLGNVAGGGYTYMDTRHSEWNIYVDPKAAKAVFESRARYRLVPLDACNQVPVDLAFLDLMVKRGKSKLGRFAAEVLESSRSTIAARIYFAWDPLAAVALLNPDVLKISSVGLDVVQEGNEAGQTKETPGRLPSRVALGADKALFQSIFLAALGK